MTETHPTRPGPRRTLSEQAILDAALALLAELGAERVTIRGIATRVGIAPNAVYTYFPDKAAVLSGLAEQLLGRVYDDRFNDPSQPWRDRIHTLARDLRTELITHPGSVHLLLTNTMDGPNAKAITATLLTILSHAGLTPDTTTHASHLINAHILGTVALETTHQTTTTDQFHWGLDRLLDGLTMHVAARPRASDHRSGPASS